MEAKVLRVMPATPRVQILLDVLGGPTWVAVNWASAVLEKNTVADQVPNLAASARQRMRIQVEVEGAANNSSSKVNFGGETAGLAES